MKLMNEGEIRVLLVEDNQFAQMAAKIVLTKICDIVDCALTKEEAIKHVMSNKYDIIFMDISLGVPDIDGFIVAKEIKEKSKINCVTPIIALTAHSGTEFKEKSIEIGMCDFVVKPLTKKSVLEVFDKCVRK
jgi:CheY-like chemotaxis protein